MLLGRRKYNSFWCAGRKHKARTKKLKLLIVDPTVIGEYDYLALPADLEEGVIKECLTILGALPKQVDKVSDSNNQL